MAFTSPWHRLWGRDEWHAYGDEIDRLLPAPYLGMLAGGTGQFEVAAQQHLDALFRCQKTANLEGLPRQTPLQQRIEQLSPYPSPRYSFERLSLAFRAIPFPIRHDTPSGTVLRISR